MTSWMKIGALPDTMSGVIKIATEAIVTFVRIMQYERLIALDFAINGGDVNTGRGIFFDNQSASDWVKDPKHGENALTDPAEFKRVLTILRWWGSAGDADPTRYIDSAMDCVRMAMEKVDSICNKLQQLNQAIEQRNAATVDQSLGLKTTGNYSVDWAGRGEKWMKGDDGWYFIVPGGEIFKWNGGRYDDMQADFVSHVDNSFYENPQELHTASDRQLSAGEIDQAFDLTFAGDYHHNWAGTW